jgi:hypothetical protein
MIKPNSEKIRYFSLHRGGIKNQCIVGNFKSFHDTEASRFLQMQKYAHISSKILKELKIFVFDNGDNLDVCPLVNLAM